MPRAASPRATRAPTRGTSAKLAKAAGVNRSEFERQRTLRKKAPKLRGLKMAA
jgi:hypothetical protein